MRRQNPAYRYHPESEAQLEKNAKIPPSMFYGDLQKARERSRIAANGSDVGNYDFDGTRTEFFVPIPDSDETLPLYVYRPSNLRPDAAILIFFHGGAFVFGGRENVEKTCQVLAYEGKCLVVNPEFRQAPEFRFPIPLDDTCAITRWVLDNKTLIGGSEASKVGVGGGSSGGTIAASVAHDVPGLAFQILIYAKLMDSDERSLKSYDEFSDPAYTSGALQWYIDQFIDPADYQNPRVSVIRRPSFDKLPPTQFIVAECDTMRDESYEYCKKLTDAGVTVDFQLIEGAVHAFYTKAGAFPTLAHEAYAKTVDFINKWGY